MLTKVVWYAWVASYRRQLKDFISSECVPGNEAVAWPAGRVVAGRAGARSAAARRLLVFSG